MFALTGWAMYLRNVEIAKQTLQEQLMTVCCTQSFEGLL
jgi:hypothetical protein